MSKKTTYEHNLKVNSDGGLDRVSRKASKAGSALGDTAQQADLTGTNLKGISQQSSNATKNFSKMSRGMSGSLVPAYAVLASNIFALSAAYRFLKEQMDIGVLIQGQKDFASATGSAIQSIVNRVRDASDHMLSFQAASQSAAIAIAKGFSVQQVEDLTDGARRAATALGRDFQDAFDRLVRGASKAEPELLDELGITLRLATATEKYAATIGKTAKQLTAYERSQAVLIETQRQLDEYYGDIDPQSNPIIQLSETFTDLIKIGSQKVLPFFKGLVGFINNNASAAMALFSLFVVGIGKEIFRSQEYVQRFNARFENVNKTMTKSSARLKALKADSRALSGSLKSIKQVGLFDLEELAREHPNQKGLAAKLRQPYKVNALDLRNLNTSIKAAEAQFRKHGQVVSGYFKGMSREVVRQYKHALTIINTANKTTFTEKFRHYGLRMKAGWDVTVTAMEVRWLKFQKVIHSTMALAGKLFRGVMKIVTGYFIIDLLASSWGAIKKNAFTAIHAVLGGLDKAINALINKMNSILDWWERRIKGVLNLVGLGGEFTSNVKPSEYTPELIEQTKLSLMDKIAEQEKSLADLRIKYDKKVAQTYHDNLRKGAKWVWREDLPGWALSADDPRKLGQVMIESWHAARREIAEESVESPLGWGLFWDNRTFWRAIHEEREELESLKNQLSALEQIRPGDAVQGPSNMAGAFENSFWGQFLKEVGDAETRIQQLKDSLDGLIDRLNTVNKDFKEVRKTLDPLQTDIDELGRDSLASFNDRLKETQKITRFIAEVGLDDILSDIRFEFGADDAIKQRTDALKGFRNTLLSLAPSIPFLEQSLDAIDEAWRDDPNALYNNPKFLQFFIRFSRTANSTLSSVTAVNDGFKNTHSIFDKLATGSGLRVTKQRLEQLLKSASEADAGFGSMEGTSNYLDQFRDRGLQEALANIDILIAKFEKLNDTRTKLAMTRLDFDYLPPIAREYADKDLQVQERQNALDFLYLERDQRQTELRYSGEEDKPAVLDKLAELEPRIKLAERELNKAKKLSSEVFRFNLDVTKSIETNLASAFDQIIQGTHKAKDAFKHMGVAILKTISQMISKMIAFRIVAGIFGQPTTPGTFTAPTVEGPASSAFSTLFRPAPVTGSGGGVFDGPRSGYPAVLHGKEAVVPLPNNGAIPVDIRGADGGTNNVTVNVSMEGGAARTETSGDEGSNLQKLGKLVAGAVQKELANQRRSGGYLSPYGVV